MTQAVPIRVPQATVSDDEYIITDFAVKNGDCISIGDVIATLEHSKSTFDIISPVEGFVFTRYRDNDSVRVGELLAVVSADSQFSWNGDEATLEQSKKSAANAAGNVRFSNAAVRLIDEQGIDRSIFAGMKMVTKADVESQMQAGQQVQPVASGEISCGQDLVIIGGGGHAKMCIDVLRQMQTFNIAGIVLPNLDNDARVLGVPVIGRDEDLPRIHANGAQLAIVAIGSVGGGKRQRIYQQLKRIGFQVPNLIHPRATIEPSARMGDGNQIFAGAVIGSCAQLDNNCIVNCNSVLSHDCRLGDNVHIAPGAVLAGMVSVGPNTLVGMGATVYLGVRIGQDVVVNNGVNVVNNVPDGSVVKS